MKISMQAIWHRFHGVLEPQSTMEISRRTDLPEPEIDNAVHRCLDARATGRLMPWNED